jgi:AmmeMemoRadiSam system protein A
MTSNKWLIAGWMLAMGVVGCGEAGPAAPPSTQTKAAPEAAAQVPQGKSEATVRPAAVAGLFYPSTKASLEKEIDEYLAAAKPAGIKQLRGLVVPHAGYRYSGPTAAVGYKQVVGRDIRTVVVLSPSHYAAFQGALVTEADAYETPLGRVSLAPMARELGAHRPFVVRPPCRVERPSWSSQSPREIPPRGEELPDTWEHSLEVQVPFLQKTVADFKLVPIVFGDVDPEAVARELAKRLDEKTLIVASSDLSHYHPDKKARDLDTTCIEAVCRLNCQWMAEQEACGKTPILTLMHIARSKGWKTRLLDYRNSGDTSGDRSAVVGYAAIAFFEPEGAAEALPAPTSGWTPAHRKTLLTLARQSLGDSVRSGKAPEVDLAKYDAKLAGPRACFVTLTKKGDLRGCIGHIFPREPLVKAVVHNAAAAALEDPRFPPVGAQELGEIDIEVSILTLPEHLESKSPEDLLAKLRPKIDGVVLRVGRRQATYLPQVWEQLPEKESFLSHLAEKAGLNAADWKRPEAEVLVYQVEAFHEKEEAKAAGK